MGEYENLCDLVEYLIRNKYYNNHTSTDEQFFEMTLNRVKKYVFINDDEPPTNIKHSSIIKKIRKETKKVIKKTLIQQSDDTFNTY